MWLSISFALAQVHTIRAPFPTQRLFEVPDTVCLNVDADLGMHETEVEDGRFRATCSSSQGRTTACMTLLTATWPTRYAPLRCQGDQGTLVLEPVPAFDPDEDIEDGVDLVHRVDVIQGAFHTGLADAVGMMDQGECGVKDGRFFVKTESREKKQSCLLVFLDTSEKTIPVRLVSRLKDRTED